MNSRRYWALMTLVVANILFNWFVWGSWAALINMGAWFLALKMTVWRDK